MREINFINLDQFLLECNPQVHTLAKLWQGVILQAFIDSSPSKSQSKTAQKKAISWLMLDNDDFFTVCDFACIDGGKLRNNLHKIIK